MALIEIDVAPMAHSGPPSWNVKINASERFDHLPDIHRKDFTSVKEALEFVREWMDETIYL